MKVLEFLNDNPPLGMLGKESLGTWHMKSKAVPKRIKAFRAVFGGNRRPIVEFAVEDKRKLGTQLHGCLVLTLLYIPNTL